MTRTERRLIAAAICVSVIVSCWHIAAPQRQFAADLWRDIGIQWAWPEIER